MITTQRNTRELTYQYVFPHFLMDHPKHCMLSKDVGHQTLSIGLLTRPIFLFTAFLRRFRAIFLPHVTFPSNCQAQTLKYGLYNRNLFLNSESHCSFNKGIFVFALFFGTKTVISNLLSNYVKMTLLLLEMQLS